MRRKHLIFAVAISLLLGSFIALVAVSQQKTVPQLVSDMNNARNALYRTKDPKGAWTIYEDAFDVLESMIDDLKDKLEDLYNIKIDSGGKWDAIVKAKKSIDESSGIKAALAAVEKKREEVEDLWLDAYDAWQAYHNAVAAYNSHRHVSPEERLDVPGLDKFVATSIYTCHGLCDVPFETESLAQVSHQAYCSEKHGTLGATGVTYWTCFGNTTCQRSSEHWKQCRASNCSVLFPPLEHEHEYDSYDHKVKCTESVYSFWNRNATCGKEYYTCESSTCPDSSRHGSTPSYHACGVHETSVSGSHSYGTYTCGSHSGYACQESNDHETYISSCSETENGQTCDNSSGYYECSPHSHTYSISSGSTAPSTPSTPSSNTTTCDAGHSYRADHPNVEYLDNFHRTRTCRFSGCSNTWQACVNGWSAPLCNNPYRKRNGWNCGAQ